VNFSHKPYCKNHKYKENESKAYSHKRNTEGVKDMFKKIAGLKFLGFLVFLFLFFVMLCPPVVNAEPSDIPSWAEPGVDVVYGGSLWEYFPADNVSSKITNMEQEFNIGFGNYTPNMYWDFGLYKFTVISADEQQGVFEVESGRLGLYGYEWNGEDIIWNYIWENQTWMENGTETGFWLTIYVPPAQLSGNPELSVGDYQAYKTTEVAGPSKMIYKYFEKDTGRLLYTVSFYPEVDSDFSVFGLAMTSSQTIVFEEKPISVTSNSSISNMEYNAANGTLSFSATGQTGTTGYAEIAISQGLCANISSMKVYVDGVETEFTYKSLDASYDVYWVLTVVYQHSTHNIQVTIPEFSSFALIACTATTIAAFASLCLKKSSRYFSSNKK
jgi:hypothetical protein